MIRFKVSRLPLSNDKIRIIFLFFTVDNIRNSESEVLILDIATLRPSLPAHGHLLFPGAGIGHHMGDVALVGVGGINRAGSVKIHIACGAHSVVWSQIGLMAFSPSSDSIALIDSIGRIMSKFD